MSKKILFLSNSKLAILSTVLLLAVFCTIGMSFTPAEEGENIGSPNDSVQVHGPRYIKTGACDSYYAKLTASVADGTGSGTVYVAAPTIEAEVVDNDPSAHATSSEKTSSDSQSADFYFTAYATAQHGSVFNSWSAPSGDGTPTICDGYSSTSNPILVKVTSASNNGTNKATIQANFIATSEVPFDIYFLSPEGNGTYAVTSYIGYPTPVQGGDPIPSYSSDEIILTATNGEGYGFRRFYYIDADGKKKTLGEFAQKQQVVTLSSEMKKIGCEFVEAWEVNYVTATNGSYTAKNGSTALTVDADPVTTTTTYADDNITLAATPSTGYAFFRYLGTDTIGNTYTIGTIGLGTQTVNIPQNTVSVTAEFTDKPFIVGASLYSDLDGAIQATRKDDGAHKGVILLVNDYTVPAGYYTIPAGVTLLIPRGASQVLPTKIVERNSSSSDAESGSTPTVYKTLTLGDNVSLDVFGDIEIGGKQNSYRMSDVGTGRPIGPGCGLLSMEALSSITLEPGSNLRAWGFVTGSGKIDVRRGARVDEMFQIMDFKGGSATTSSSFKNKKVFPLHQYFIQNVEVRTTYHPGAALFTSSGAIGTPMDNIKIIGIEGDEAALFLLDNEDDSEDTWVCKWYDATTDQQVYEVNNSAKLSNIKIIITNYGMEYPFNSKDFVLPVTNNMKIHLLQGKMNVTQNTMLLPGAEMEVDKQATIIVDSNMSLYLIDANQWGTYTYSGVYARRVKYRPDGVPTVRDISSAEGLGDAKLDVHGTLDVQGYLYTTEGGASIFSNNGDAGTIMFTNAAPTENGSLNLNTSQNNTTPNFTTFSTPSAKLLNGDNSYATTAGTPAGQSYCYMNGKWTMMTVDPDNGCFVYDNYGTYYAKPGAYVALANGKTENGDHTYSDADGRGRLYILMDECQWWEVQNDNNLYKGITRDENDVASWNGKYYEYNTSTNKWEEKRYTITWKDHDGSVITTYRLTYGTIPQYLSTNPTREADVDYTYNFSGWSPAFTPVNGDQIYTATYSKTRIKYTIIFKFIEDINDGAEIDRQQLARDEMPTAPTITPREGWYIKWTPAIGAVTGNATYEAEWIEDLPDYYTITWKNYDGATLATTTPARDATAATVLAESGFAASKDAEGVKPEKPATSEYRYEFTGWSPTVAAATADAVYTAQYNEVAQTYAIRFYREDGTTQLGETQNLALGANPVVPAYSKANTAEYTYQLQWKIKDTETIVGVGVPSVSGAADYQADFISTKNRYTISATCATPSSCVITGGGVYDYGTSVDLEANPNEGYEFVKWSDEVTDNPRRITVSGNSTYTAIVNPIELTVAINAKKTIALPTTLAGLTISSDGDDESSELFGAENLSFADGGSAYINFTFGDTESRHWHAFTVPFQVNLKESTGARALINGEPLMLGRGYDIVYYDGNVRAVEGKTANCWKYVEDPIAEGGSDSIMYPGKAYMIASAGRAINTVRFTAQLDANHKLILAGGMTVTAGSGADGGWNGIGNPNIFHSIIDAGPTVGYVHDGGKIGEDGYDEYNINNLKYVVGRAVYVQVTGSGTQSVVVNQAGGQGVITPLSAPARNKAQNRTDAQYMALDDYYKVSLSSDNGVKGSNVYVLNEEDKEDTYVIGHDLAKMGMSTTRAHIWVNRYDNQLCLNTTAPVNGQAIYPLGLYAPKAGDYTICLQSVVDEEYAVYLTLDGEAIWNLSDGAYVLTLDKGTTNRYGLRISSNAPQVTTGIDEAVVDAQGETQKILINDHVYIIRGNNVYTIDGQLVK